MHLEFCTPALCEIKQVAKSIENNRLFDPVSSKNTELVNLINSLNDIFIISQKRVRGTYTRQAKLLSFVIGLIIAFLFNADSLYMFKHLSFNQVDSSDIVSSLQSIEECASGENPDDCLQKNISKINSIFSSNSDSFPLGWQFTGPNVNVNSDDSDEFINKLSHDELIEAYNKFSGFKQCFNPKSSNDYANFRKCYHQFLFNIGQTRTNKKLTNNFGNFFQAFNNNISQQCSRDNYNSETCNNFIETSIENIALSGFNAATQATQKNNFHTTEDISNNIKVHQGGWFLAIFGWLITALAISMGAPFWFDLLFKVLKFRAPSPETNRSLPDDSVSSRLSGSTDQKPSPPRTDSALNTISDSNPKKPREIEGPGMPPPPPN